jgi:hypothetical protein
MDDDEYWSTITFDKPKFPWRQNGEQPPEPRGNDPLAHSGPPQGPGQVPQGPPPGDSRPVGPINTPAPPTAPQPAIPADPLDTPARRSGDTDPGSVPSFGSAEQGGRFSPYGSDQQQQQNNGYGDDPLNTGERPTYGSRGARPPATPQPPAPPVPSSAPPTTVQPAVPAADAGSGDEDDRLPSVDELLAKIQSNRKRSATESDPAPSGYESLNDPLSDPLNTGEHPSPYGSGSSSYGSSSYGSSPSAGSTPSAGSGWSPSDDYGSDPLGAGYSGSSSGGNTGGYASPSYDSGYGSSSGYSGSDSSGYGSSSSHQDDPLGTGYSGSSSDYGSSGGGYSSDFGGNSYNGSQPSYGDSGYYGSNPQGQQGYDPDAPATPSHPSEESTQAYPTSPYGNSYGSEDNRDKDKPPEEWNSYGDYRR